MKRLTLIRSALLGGAALALAGCGGGGSSSSTPAPVTALKLEDTFGTQFGVDYRTDPNTQPAKPAAGDIIPLDLTAPPKPLH